MSDSGSRGVWFGVVGVAVAGAAAAFWLSRGAETPAAPPGTTAAPAPVAAPAAPPAPVAAPLPTPASTGIPEADCIAFPDGTRLPPLNGVKKAPAMTFHRLVPYAKVLRKEFDKATGLEWYIHENGVRSTTRLQWRNGVQEAVAEIEMPRAVQPVVDTK